MNHFLIKTLSIILLFVAIIAALAWLTPVDPNNYLMAYNKKMTWLETCPQPRVIFIGGSNLAFGLDSHMIQDSLHCHVVNMGLHGGTGIRYPVEDCLKHIRPHDIVVLQFEYGNFFSGGNGELETMPQFMMAIGWKNMDKLNTRQLINVIAGLPRLAAGNAKRLAMACWEDALHADLAHNTFHYAASGFNELGDEVSHWTLPPQAVESSSFMASTAINRDFMAWLKNVISRYEKCGATVVMLPPVCPKSHFDYCYNSYIDHALDSIGRPYAIPPVAMALDDRYAYNGGYHINRDGVTINSRRIISVLRNLHIPEKGSNFAEKQRNHAASRQ